MAKTIEGKDKDSAGEMMADSQLLVNYRGSRWVGEDATPVDGLGSPRPGDRAPDVRGLGRHFVARPIRLFELMRGVGHTLLFYADESAGERDFEALAAIADGLSTGYPGARGGSVYLIRPDGYLGYRAAIAAREPLVSHVRRVLPTRPLGRGALIAWRIGRATRRRRSRPRRGRMGVGRCYARERSSGTASRQGALRIV